MEGVGPAGGGLLMSAVKKALPRFREGHPGFVTRGNIYYTPQHLWRAAKAGGGDRYCGSVSFAGALGDPGGNRVFQRFLRQAPVIHQSQPHMANERAAIAAQQKVQRHVQPLRQGHVAVQIITGEMGDIAAFQHSGLFVANQHSPVI